MSIFKFSLYTSKLKIIKYNTFILTICAAARDTVSGRTIRSVSKHKRFNRVVGPAKIIVLY